MLDIVFLVSFSVGLYRQTVQHDLITSISKFKIAIIFIWTQLWEIGVRLLCFLLCEFNKRINLKDFKIETFDFRIGIRHERVAHRHY